MAPSFKTILQMSTICLILIMNSSAAVRFQPRRCSMRCPSCGPEETREVDASRDASYEYPIERRESDFNDRRGDADCKCRCGPSYPICSPMVCWRHCPGGYIYNSKGCKTCNCKPFICPHKVCTPSKCKNGFTKDYRGCNTCFCKPSIDCPRHCPFNYSPVCGTDNKTYSNSCLLKIASCRRSKLGRRVRAIKKETISELHSGPCGSPPMYAVEN